MYFSLPAFNYKIDSILPPHHTTPCCWRFTTFFFCKFTLVCNSTIQSLIFFNLSPPLCPATVDSFSCCAGNLSTFSLHLDSAVYILGVDWLWMGRFNLYIGWPRAKGWPIFSHLMFSIIFTAHYNFILSRFIIRYFYEFMKSCI